MLEYRVERWNYTLVASSRKKTIRGNQKLSHSKVKNNKVRLQYAIIFKKSNIPHYAKICKNWKQKQINSSIKVFHVKLKIKKIDGHLKPQE